MQELYLLRTKLGENHLRGLYTDEMFKEQSASLEHKILIKKSISSEANLEQLDIDTVVNFMNDLLWNLGKAWREGTLLQRKKLSGSIFPKKVYFKNGEFRTEEIGLAYKAIGQFATTPSSLRVSQEKKMATPVNGFRNMGKFKEYLRSVTDPDVVRDGNQDVLGYSGDTALEHAIRMAKAGQPFLVVDNLLVALNNSDISEEQGALILATAMETQAKIMDANTRYYPKKEHREEAEELRNTANELRQNGFLPPFVPPPLTEEQVRANEEFVKRVQEKLPLLKIIREPNEGACEMRYWEKSFGRKSTVQLKGKEPRCGFPGERDCQFPNTDQT